MKSLLRLCLSGLLLLRVAGSSVFIVLIRLYWVLQLLLLTPVTSCSASSLLVWAINVAAVLSVITVLSVMTTRWVCAVSSFSLRTRDSSCSCGACSLFVAASDCTWPASVTVSSVSFSSSSLLSSRIFSRVICPSAQHVCSWIPRTLVVVWKQSTAVCNLIEHVSIILVKSCSLRCLFSLVHVLLELRGYLILMNFLFLIIIWI